MENKNIIGRSADVNLPNKSFTEPHQNFTGSYKQSVEDLDELQDTQNIKR